MIKTFILSTAKNLIRRMIVFLTWDQWATRSWSQEGEDMVLRRIFENQKVGMYIDVGAHHPKRFSNTYFFYRRGWSGINIDAMPGSMGLFKKHRPRDINLEMGVANCPGEMDYYVFNEPALNGFSADISSDREKSENSYFLKKVIKVRVSPLSEILAEHLGDRKVDFLSIDVEGLDLEVLKSNNWSRNRPKFVLVEVLKSSLHELDSDPVSRFMSDCGYVFYAKQVNTVFFKDSKLNVV